MPYNVNKSNGDLLVVVEDGTVDVNSTSIALVGKNYPGYGEFLNENLVHIMENFASTGAPEAPLEGQLWYDTASQILKFYNGSVFTNTGVKIELDTVSTNMHYPLLVPSETGVDSYKITKSKGLGINPSTGRIGINLDLNPEAAIEINLGLQGRLLANGIAKSTPDSGLYLHGADGSDAGIAIDCYAGTSLSKTPAIIARTTRGTAAAKQALLVNQTMLNLVARGWQGAQWSQNNAGFVVRANENWTSTAQGSQIELYTTRNGTAIWSKSLTLAHNGDLSVTGDVTAFDTSDIILKTDIARIEFALEKICRLDGITHGWKEESGKDLSIKTSGVIAQQVQEILPEAVQRKTSGFLGVDYKQLVPLLIEAIKDLKSQIDSLRADK